MFRTANARNDRNLHVRLEGVVYSPVSSLVFQTRSVRKHSPKQIAKLTASLIEFGAVVPVLIDPASRVIDGEAIVLAARQAGLTDLPTLQIKHLSPEQLRVLRLTLNRMIELAEWDREALQMELSELVELDLDFSIEITGWDMVEIERLVLETGQDDDAAAGPEIVPDPPASPTTMAGDLWQLGAHRLLCGSSLEPENWTRIMDGKQARMVFSDPPYNVPITGNVSGLGKVKHDDFAMATGEMSDAQFQAFLASGIGCMAEHLVEGAVLDICMDWRGLSVAEAALRECGLKLINVCVWNKANGGMGSLYRSKHEFVLIAKKGSAPHVNNVQLGQFGRYRTNVWDYAGANSFGAGRNRDLQDHPTVKPTALVADAIRDVTNLGDLVLDGFIGSGATILAAERTRRRCYGIELEPKFVDIAIRRWQEATGKRAVLQGTDEPFDQVKQRRSEPAEQPGMLARVHPNIRHRERPLAA